MEKAKKTDFFGITKKILTAALIVVLLTWGVPKVYHFFFASIPLPQHAYDSEDLPQLSAEGYDYRRMLRLIEQSKQIKSDFYANFRGYPAKRKPIDMKAAKELLSDLYREKIRLAKHVRTVKVLYKGELPAKKQRTLLYYQEVVDKCARDLEQILRQA